MERPGKIDPIFKQKTHQKLTLTVPALKHYATATHKIHPSTQSSAEVHIHQLFGEGNQSKAGGL